ncbi:MAG: TIGR03960 family radical SAM protein [Clostridiales bacterium]|nr:MAG: TIGR03960 family radical SAM protein [Clostridiales bacterium]
MKTDRYAALLRRVEKPGRYTGGEFGEVYKENMPVRMCFCFPDTYEIGMSNLGMKILTGALNRLDFLGCERCFTPWADMEAELRKTGTKLFALESGDPLDAFDVVAFTMQYELCYTNVVNMLRLAGIPPLARDRGEDAPLILGGGPCTYNPEPMADFFDIFSIGEGEEALPELLTLYYECRENGLSKREFLRRAAGLEGFYVPSLYDVTYNADGTLASFAPNCAEAPARITKRVIPDLDTAYFPTDAAVPFLETVHDRVTMETSRGCIRGCRFCQAGIVYRPYREKSVEKISSCAADCVRYSGYSEISLSSLSISDYSEIRRLIDELLGWTEPRSISLSLPSMRIDAFYGELMRKVMSVRKSGLTFAPEAGTQRLRDVINKNITEAEILAGCREAFDNGRTALKLYFMNGLPTETDADIEGIAALAQRIVDAFYETKRNGKGFNVTVSVSCFVPKPFTPFQWEAQDSIAALERKQQLLRDAIRTRKITYHYHDAHVSYIEAVFARGDRRLSRAILEAVDRGQRLDGWDEFFRFDTWIEAFAAAGIDPDFYAARRRPYTELLPWDHIDCGVSRAFLVRESEKARAGVTTPDCRTQCAGCGANRLGGTRSCCP